MNKRDLDKVYGYIIKITSDLRHLKQDAAKDFIESEKDKLQSFISGLFLSSIITKSEYNVLTDFMVDMLV